MFRIRPMVLASALAASIAILAPAMAPADPPRPAPPRPAPPCASIAALPQVIQTRYTLLGAAQVLGCFREVTNEGAYRFEAGEIKPLYAYGANTTMDATIDREGLIHLFWGSYDGLITTPDHWLVRVTYHGQLVNQVKYNVGDRDIGGNYGANVIVHPAGRRGPLQIAIEYCHTTFDIQHDCSGWSQSNMTVEL